MVERCLKVGCIFLLKNNVIGRNIRRVIRYVDLTCRSYIGPRVYPRGVLCNHPCPWSVRPFVFKYLRDRSKDFSNFLHEVSAP